MFVFTGMVLYRTVIQENLEDNFTLFLLNNYCNAVISYMYSFNQ